MERGGFAGQILDVDLSTKLIRIRALADDLTEKYIGGLGLTFKLAYDEITPGQDPLSPENPIVLGAGPFVGTNIPATSRVYGVTKLPQSKAIGWCGGGGLNFGCNLKYAGYDHVIVKGRADKPVYLSIQDNNVEIKDASHLRGKMMPETTEALCEEIGRPSGVMAIGPGGENLVSFSMAVIDQMATLGRGGFGAVMGSKNLKAIVVKGSKGIGVADRKRYRELNRKLLSRIKTYPYLKESQELGLMKSMPLVPKEAYLAMKKRRTACVSCPIGDKDVVRIPDGEFEGLMVCSTSAANLLSPMFYGMKDYRKAIRLVARLDDYGLDMFEFFGVLGFVRSLAEAGLIPSDRGTPEIDYASLASMEAWARKIAFREGLGDVLAGGFEAIINAFGPDSVPYAPYISRGMHPYVGPKAPIPYDLFGTQELGQALDPRGPHVGAGGSPTYFARRPLEVFPKHLRRMGVPEEAIARIVQPADSPAEENLKIGSLLKYSHRWFSTLGSMGICARAQINRWYDWETCAQFYEAVTGIETSLEALSERVERIWTLYRLLNIREGMTRADDSLPGKWFEEPTFKNYLTGETLSREDAEQMVSDYYQEWGWDPETGTPSNEYLRNLGLELCLP